MMNVLSLFNGFGGAFLALDSLGIKPGNLYVSEVDKYAITVADKLNPSNINLGDVKNIDVKKIDPIDLIVGGSPCTSFSFAGKRNGMSTSCETKITSLEQYLELKDGKFEFEGQSYLFWEYMRILKDIQEYNPDVKFFLENVVMAKEWEVVLSKAIGIAPVVLNSSRLSAQNRKRLYWSNIKTTTYGLFNEITQDVDQPEDKGILLKDVLEREVDEKYYLSDEKIKELDNSIGSGGEIKQIGNIVKTGNFSNPERGRIYSIDGKSPTLNTCSGGGLEPKILKVDKKFKPKPNQNKGSCLTAGGHSGGNHSDMDLLIENNIRIRRLTPRECFRLQTVAEHHINTILSSGVSNSQLYKMCGNGWTIEVIAHFFKHLL